ncbi:MAG: hypothetical protein NZ518_07355 [Dehalococcoidia bacterium]|nr:hypothetical protein [Dehalococcoidia bacterium]
MCSRFLWEDFLRLQHEHLFPVVCDTPALAERRAKADLHAQALALLAAAPTPAAKVDALNAFKDREMFRIDLRHITGRSDFATFSDELTDLTEVTVMVAADLAMSETRARFGAPRLPDGRDCHWGVFALGKFGGRELGYSSDLELLFIYDGEGQTDGPARLANSEFFSAFVHQFVASVRARQEGVFEIDLRLRPYGKAGAMATALDGFRRYYRRDGDAEQFERMALVRLRPIAGDAQLADQVTQARDAFVYSDAPLDLANIRHFRQRQATELVAPGAVNAKYSHGGLLDVEYFVQAWQITVGRHDLSARVTNTQAAIARLEAGGYLPPALVAELRETHQFLRRLIDALRVVRGNAKDLTIPDPQSREFAYLAGRMRAPSAADLQRTVAERMAFARQVWEAAPPPA